VSLQGRETEAGFVYVLNVYASTNCATRFTTIIFVARRTIIIIIAELLIMRRMEKDKQQLVIEIDSISTALDAANKAKVTIIAVCSAFVFPSA